MVNIKKEDLIVSEIYKCNNGDITYIIETTENLKNVKNIPSYGCFMKQGGFNVSHLTFTNATPEEKHWLNECIKADKFIEYEEAMKSFVPEYVECTLQRNGSSYKLETIYKTNLNGLIIGGMAFYQLNKKRFKPSTKEAYDAQFVVEEPDPLPQFKVIESVETITKVENNEGNQFFIGDVVKSSTDVIHIIKGFKYDINETAILALTDKVPTIGIGINKIEHYIEPKVEPKKETLLEKAKKLYPVGTKFKCIYQKNNSVNEIYEVIEKASQTSLFSDIKLRTNNPKGVWKNIYDIGLNQWAEIIEDKPKVGDKFKMKQWEVSNPYIITEIVDSENPYCKYKNENNYLSTGTVLLKNIKIIK